MTAAQRPVLLVGGIPGDSAEEILRVAGPAIGDLAVGLTDGEFDERRSWVFFVFKNLWMNHPDLTLTSPPDPAKGYAGLPRFTVNEGSASVSTDGHSTQYPAVAAESYKVFRRLREEGVIPKGLRFQVCIPFPDDAARLAAEDSESMNLMLDAYITIVQHDIAALCQTIPHEDLILQWDINWETLAIELDDYLPGEPPFHYRPDQDAMTRFIRFLKELNGSIPETVPVGIHLCYGDYNNTHFKEPKDLSTSVLMANTAVKESPHEIAYVHMSVPIDRSDDAYFEPLKDLSIGDVPVYAGLTHYKDGYEGSLKRLEVFKKHYHGPTGVTTECGLGRRPPNESIEKWFDIHRQLTRHL